MSFLLIILPIFTLVGVGYLLRFIGLIDRQGISTLNRFVYNVSLPALIIMSFWNIDWRDTETLYTLIINTFLLLSFAFLLFLTLKLFPISPKLKAAIFASGLVGNTIYMGFPIGERALTEEMFSFYVAAATPHLVMGIVISVLAIQWYLSTSHGLYDYTKKFLFNPLIISLLCGIGLSLSGISGVLMGYLQEVGRLLATPASPIALITLGAFMYKSFIPKLAGWAVFGTAVKLAVLPLFLFIGGTLLDVDSEIMIASVLAGAMPTAVTSFVIAEQYDASPELVATTLFVSTLCAIGSLSLVLIMLL